MAAATIDLELSIGGETIAVIKVPVTITAGALTSSGHVPLNVDTDDLSRRIREGAHAFAAAVR